MLDAVVLPQGTRFWWERSDAELDALYATSMTQGTNSSDEPCLFDRMGSSTLKESVIGSVMKTRHVTWEGPAKKPTHLIEVLVILRGAPAIVKIQDPRRS